MSGRRWWPSHATLTLRGVEVEVGYRILGEGPGSGWEVDWDFRSDVDREAIGEWSLTAEEEDAINTAIIIAEGRTP